MVATGRAIQKWNMFKIQRNFATEAIKTCNIAMNREFYKLPEGYFKKLCPYKKRYSNFSGKCQNRPTSTLDFNF